MICQNCHNQSSNIKYFSGVGERCHICGDFSEASGTKTTGLLTRQSSRIRHDQPQYQADMLPPHTYDKVAGKWVPNPDFISRHPDQAKNFMSGDEMRKAKLPKLAEHAQKQTDRQIAHKEKMRASTEFVGDATKAVKKVVEG
jgi:hypothetical protein